MARKHQTFVWAICEGGSSQGWVSFGSCPTASSVANSACQAQVQVPTYFNAVRQG